MSEAVAVFAQKEFELKGIFRNALTFSLAMKITDAIHQDDVLIVIPSSIVLLYLFMGCSVLTQHLIDSAPPASDGGASLLAFVSGPLAIVRDLLDLAATVFTQFIGTLLSQYVTALPPEGQDANPITEILPITLMALTYFYIGQQAYDATHTSTIKKGA
jgi:hypothetical protein